MITEARNLEEIPVSVRPVHSWSTPVGTAKLMRYSTGFSLTVEFFCGKRMSSKTGNTWRQKKFVTPLRDEMALELLHGEVSPAEAAWKYHRFQRRG